MAVTVGPRCTGSRLRPNVVALVYGGYALTHYGLSLLWDILLFPVAMVDHVFMTMFLYLSLPPDVQFMLLLPTHTQCFMFGPTR